MNAATTRFPLSQKFLKLVLQGIQKLKKKDSGADL